MGAVERQLLWRGQLPSRGSALSANLDQADASDWVAEFRCNSRARLRSQMH